MGQKRWKRPLNENRALRTVMRHCLNVKQALGKIISNLQNRAEMHDYSKLEDDEFDAVIHYQKLDGLKYGSDAYKAKMNEIRQFTGEGWHLHCQRNSHHPEHHQHIDDMNLLDIIEMVCDWKAANATYNTSGQSFRDSAAACMERYDFNDSQKWVIRQMIDILDSSEDS